jgi:hypothetical protein
VHKESLAQQLLGRTDGTSPGACSYLAIGHDLHTLYPTPESYIINVYSNPFKGPMRDYLCNIVCTGDRRGRWWARTCWQLVLSKQCAKDLWYTSLFYVVLITNWEIF